MANNYSLQALYDRCAYLAAEAGKAIQEGFTGGGLEESRVGSRPLPTLACPYPWWLYCQPSTPCHQGGLSEPFKAGHIHLNQLKSQTEVLGLAVA